MDDRRIVAPLTRRQIEFIAAEARAALELTPDGWVSMQAILEDVLHEVVEDYEFHVRDDHEMRGMEGLTDENRPIIHLANRTYRELEKGNGRARMTAAHEFGHLVLHSGAPSYRAFTEKYDALFDPERQANVFAAAFLMPEKAFRQCRTEQAAMRRFGVSRDAVACRARILRHIFAHQRRHQAHPGKKKGGSLRHTP